MVEIYNKIFKAYPSYSHYLDITHTKMSDMPLKVAIPPARSVQPIGGEYNQSLFNTGYSPLSPKGAAVVQSLQ